MKRVIFKLLIKDSKSEQTQRTLSGLQRDSGEMYFFEIDFLIKLTH